MKDAGCCGHKTRMNKEVRVDEPAGMYDNLDMKGR